MSFAILFPTGDSNEKRPGLAHLFEHLFLKYLNRHNVLCSGFTSEDYVLANFYNSTVDDVLRLLDDLIFSDSNILMEKEIILNEIQQERLSTSELFFRKLWKGTAYENSPLGSPDFLSSIAFNDLINYKYKVTSSVKYLFTSANDGSVSKIENTSWKNTIMNKSVSRDTKHRFDFEENQYIDIEIKNESEILYLIKEIISIFNPGKLVSIFEKKNIRSFVLEASCILPYREEFEKLLPAATRNIKTQLTEIENQFQDRALNELESVYYKNKKWSERRQAFFSTSIAASVIYYENLCSIIGE